MDKTEAIGLVTEYACPVLVKIYFPIDNVLDEKELISILESKTLTYKVEEQNNTVDLGYKIGKGPLYKTISKVEYAAIQFKPFVAQFNSYSKYDSTVVKVFELPLGLNKKNSAKLNYLVSHLSNNKGIVGFQTLLNDKYEEKVVISYIDTMINSQAILSALNSDTLVYSMRDGSKRKMENIFKFEAIKEMK